MRLGGGKDKRGTYGKAKMPSDEKYGKLELEGVVQIIVIDDDSRGEHDPDGDDERGGQSLWRGG
jgi:hypothetical protein